MSKFGYDEVRIKRKLLQLVVLEGFACAVLASVSSILNSTKWVFLLHILTIVIFLIFLWDLYSFSSRVRKISSSSIVIDSERLWFIGKDSFSLPFSDLRLVNIQKNKTGDVTLIRVSTSFKQNLRITGLMEMNRAYEEISRKLSQ